VWEYRERERASVFFICRKKSRKKEKDYETRKCGFEEEPSPEVSLLEGHVPLPTKFKAHPDLLHQKPLFK